MFQMGLGQGSPLLINESPMQFLPSLAAVMGEDNALFAQQLHYWLKYSTQFKEGRHWVYNTLDEWLEHFFWWSKSKLCRIVRDLQNLKVNNEIYHILIVRNMNDDRKLQRKWYSIDYDELNKLIPVAEEMRIRRKQEILANSPVLKKREDSVKNLHPELKIELPPCEKNDEKEADKNAENDVKNEPKFTHCQNDNVGAKMPSAQSGQDIVKMTIRENDQNRFTDSQNDNVQIVKMTTSTSNTLEYNTLEYSRSLSPLTPPSQENISPQEVGRMREIERDFIEAIAPLSNRDKETLAHLVSKYGEKLVREAINVSKKYGGQSLNYVKRTLEGLIRTAAKKVGEQNGRASTGERHNAGAGKTDPFWDQFGFESAL